MQMPIITPHICRRTYCSNMAKSGMSPKTLQYLMGHSDIRVTLNTYTHLGLEDAADGGFGNSEEGTGKGEVRKAGVAENVPGNLIREWYGALLWWGVFIWKIVGDCVKIVFRFLYAFYEKLISNINW